MRRTRFIAAPVETVTFYSDASTESSSEQQVIFTALICVLSWPTGFVFRPAVSLSSLLSLQRRNQGLFLVETLL